MTKQKWIDGPPPVLPKWVDQLLEQWMRLQPRVRLTLWTIVAMGITMLVFDVATKEAPPAMDTVWIAKETILPGKSEKTNAELYSKQKIPKNLIPETAVSEQPSEPVVIPIVKGTVVTTQHFTVHDLAKELPKGKTMLAVTVEDAGIFVAGMKADIWDISKETPDVILKDVTVLGVKESKVLLAIPNKEGGTIAALGMMGNLTVTPNIG